MNLSKWHAWLLAIFLLGAALRFYGLGRESLWLDEIMRVDFVTQPTISQLLEQNIELSPNHTPSNDLLLRFCGLTKTSSEFAWRVPSAVLASLTVVLMGLLARSLFGNAAGLVAAFALAVHHYHIAKGGREVGDYGQLVFVCVLMTLVFVAAVQKGAAWRWIVLGLLVGCALYSHLMSVFLCCWLAGFGILCGTWAIIERRMPFGARNEVTPLFPLGKTFACVLAVDIGGLLYSPWFFFVGTKAKNLVGDNWPHRSVTEMLKLSQDLLARADWAAFLMLFLVAVGVWASLRRHRGWGVFVLGWLAMVLPIWLVFWLNSTIVRSKYLFPSLGAVCILAALGSLEIGRVGENWARRLFKLPAREGEYKGIVAACILISVQATSGLIWVHGTTVKEPWRDIAHYLADRVSANDVVICGPPFCGQCLEFYNARLQNPFSICQYYDAVALTSKDEERLRGENGRIWVVAVAPVPHKPGMEGRHFKDVSVYSNKQQRAGTTDIRKLALDLMKNDGEADLALNAAASRLVAAGYGALACEMLEKRVQRPVPRDRLDLWSCLARAYVSVGQTDKAAGAWRSYAAMVPSDQRQYWEFVAVDVFFKAKNWKRALQETLEYLKKYDYPLAYYNVAISADCLGDHDTAYKYIVRAADRMPDSAFQQQCCAVFHLRHKKLDDAEKVIKRGLAVDPVGFPGLYILLASVYEQRGDSVHEEEVLKEGLAKTSEPPKNAKWSPDLVLKLADFYFKSGRRNDAKELLEKTLKRHPDEALLLKALNNCA